VKLEITDDAIVIQGERKAEHEEKKRRHPCDRTALRAKFFRAIPLPEGAKVAEARAKFENGILEVTVPTEEQRSERREIPIEGSFVGREGRFGWKPGSPSGSSGGSERAA